MTTPPQNLTERVLALQAALASEQQPPTTALQPGEERLPYKIERALFEQVTEAAAYLGPLLAEAQLYHRDHQLVHTHRRFLWRKTNELAAGLAIAHTYAPATEGYTEYTAQINLDHTVEHTPIRHRGTLATARGVLLRPSGILQQYEAAPADQATKNDVTIISVDNPLDTYVTTYSQATELIEPGVVLDGLVEVTSRYFEAMDSGLWVPRGPIR
ncbi:MAG TPA: hypothetical protein VLI54_01845 [Bacillota bacterium]|nr:hypothetical protein [Bacillota bacterium]